MQASYKTMRCTLTIAHLPALELCTMTNAMIAYHTQLPTQDVQSKTPLLVHQQMSGSVEGQVRCCYTFS